MRGNRGRNTKPEIALRAELHRRGLRYRVDHQIALANMRPVRPDVAFTRWKVAVFVDGCYWHGCPEHGTSPRVNASYWSAKLATNRERDRRQVLALEGAGWHVVRVWEHEEPAEAAERIAQVLALTRRAPARVR